MARKRKTARELAHEQGEHAAMDHRCPRCQEAVLERVENMLASQFRLRSILRILGKEHGLKGDAAHEYVVKAMERIEDDAKDERPYRRSIMRVSLQRVYQSAMAGKKLKEGLTALDKLCRLDGLYAPIEVKDTRTTEENIRSMTSADQRRRLDELLGGYARGKADGGPPN